MPGPESDNVVTVGGGGSSGSGGAGDEVERKIACGVPKFIIPIINDVLANRLGIINYNLEYERGSNEGDGFIGVVTRILVKQHQPRKPKVTDDDDNSSTANNNKINPISEEIVHDSATGDAPQPSTGNNVHHHHRDDNGSQSEAAGTADKRGGIFRYDDENKVLLCSLICKHLKRNPNENESLSLMDLFIREIYFYNRIKPEIERYQEERQIPSEDRFNSFPICYHASYNEESQEACLLLEDLRHQSDYHLKSKYKSPDIDFVLLLMQELGKYHALSLAMKKQVPTVFNEFKNLNDVLAKFMQRSHMRVIPDKNCRLILDQVLDKDKHPEFLFKKFEKWRKSMWSEMEKVTLLGSSAEPFSVINHGDTWVNNIMFSPKLGQIKFIDFQHARYGSPLLDVFYFLFTCTDQPLRQTYFQQIMDHYYGSLSQFLAKFNEKSEELFTRASFWAQVRKFGVIGVAMSTFTKPLTTEYVLDYSDKPEHDLVIENREKYTREMLGVIEDAIQFGILRQDTNDDDDHDDNELNKM